MLIKRVLFSSAVLWAFALSLNNWILSIFLNRHLLLNSGSISDFSALSQPYHLVFRSLDIIAGVLVVAIASALFLAQTSSRSGKLISAGAVLLGVANIVDAAMPLPCTAIVDSGCNVPLKFSLTHLVLPRHIYSSAVIGFCILLLPLAGRF